MAQFAGVPAPSFRIVLPIFAEWYLWAALTPVVVRLGAWFPLNRFPVAPRNFVVHGLGVVVASALNGVVYSSAVALLALRHSSTPFWLSCLRNAVGWIPIGAVLYGAIIAAGAAVDFARRLGEREVAAARLGEQLARARLDAVRARIHPHFLFNALHSVGALVRSGERDDAVRIVSDLSDLLREVLAQNTADLVPLSLEISFVRRYLDIEFIRFSDRLQIEWDVDGSIGDALIPPLLLQTLVENAMRHGIARSGAAGLLRITGREERGIVEIAVTDDGPGPRAADSPHAGTGFGVSAARQRLRELFGDRADVSIEPGARVGTVAKLRLPLRRRESVGAITEGAS